MDDQISAIEAVPLVEAGAVLLDVREQYEWDAGHAPQAVHIPMSQLQSRAQEIPGDRTIVCICHVGGRSAVVVNALNQGGWHALNLVGGMEAWLHEGLPIVRDDGSPGAVA
ncbi:MAG TPA: rhodanese-like domain-containing protein [Mycobacteriales bacterium]|nr:rhodanese-like domain-containing protein [Mycobacteriales bacterium]